MEAFAFVLILLFVILLYIQMRDSKDKTGKLADEIKELRYDIRKIGKLLETAPVKKPEPLIKEEPLITIKEEQKPVEQPTKEKIEEALKTIESFEKEKVIKIKTEKEEVLITQKPVEEEIKTPVYETITQPVQKKTMIQQVPKKKVNYEKYIGENLIPKIGIGILVLGLFFFVKYAIDQNWIDEIGRVAIGILCGGVLIGIAHRLRINFRPFSSLLVGGGIAVLYFTIYLAFQDYKLMSQTVAFIIMVIITAFTIILSIAYDRRELAVLSILGGFATPLMVSTGQGNYIVLFSYIMILDIGMLVLAYFKKWNIVNIVSYLFTILLYGIWFSQKVLNIQDPPYFGAFIFATLFYFTFFLMNVINNMKENQKFQIIDFSILISNTFLYYLVGMLALDQLNPDLKGLYTVMIAVFNFIFAFTLYKREQIDRNVVYLLIGLVLTFISLAAPVQLHGSYITLFWATETVLLLWLSQKSGIKLIKLGSGLVLLLMIISLLMDWNQIYGNPNPDKPLNIILNKGFITSIVCIVAVILNVNLLKNDTDIQKIGIINPLIYKNFLRIFIIVAIYISIVLELIYQLKQYIEFTSASNVILGVYNFSYVLVILVWTFITKPRYIYEGITIIGVSALLSFLVYYHQEYIDVRDAYLQGTLDSSYIVFHYLTSILTLAITSVTFLNIREIFHANSVLSKIYLWFSVFIVIFVFSAEMDHIFMLTKYTSGMIPPEVLVHSHKAGWTVLWGICAFVLMALGMKLKIKDLRIISLALLLITLVKLFLSDLSNISEGGKIIAFISLGILLLIMAFLYQKLKKIIFEDNEEEQHNENIEAQS